MICSKCNCDKKPEDFYTTKWIKGGIEAWCKECRKTYGVEYRENNRDKISARKKEWVNRNRDHVNAKQRERYQKSMKAGKR